MTTDQQERERLVVWCDEDGDYFGEGHIPPDEFRTACLRYDVEEMGVDPEVDGCADMDPADVKHERWRLKYPGTYNDEDMVRCAQNDEGAEPFTAWRR